MPGTPSYVTALISALSFRNAKPELLRTLDHSDWEELLDFGDLMHLTIPMVQRCADYCPSWVLSRVDHNIADNTRRFETIKASYAEIAGALNEAGVDHLVLKGFTKVPDYAPEPRHRIQSDIDLFCPPESILRARDALFDLGYGAQHAFDGMPWDHLPPLRRKTAWQWRGNAYDPEMPLAVELHHCFWNHATAQCGPKAVSNFWQRRVERQLEEIRFSALSPDDGLGYLALNLLRDLLHVVVVTSQVYELAWFLHDNARNEEFWNRWIEIHDDELRRFESISFLLAATWFQCDLSDAAMAEINRLPAGTRRWFEIEATSPSPMGWLRPNRDGVWLHSSLLASSAEKRRLVLGRLFPRRIFPVDAAIANWVPNSSPRETSALHKYSRYLAHLSVRGAQRISILPSTLWHGFCWWWAARS